MKFHKQLLVTAVSTLIASSAWATNGYAPHGIGQKAKGMAGASVAYPQDSLAGGYNPAGMVEVGSRIDAGIELFRPQREAKRTSSGTVYDGNDKDLFLIPEFGYNRMINNDTSFGVSVFGTGGMNTDYETLPADFSPTSAGINLMQLFIVPTWSHKINDKNSVGVGLNLAAQSFSAKGLSNFTGFSSSSANVTDNGGDISYGAGIRLGWMGKVSDTVTLGATYQSRTYMTEFDDYKGMFAEQGDFDIPSNFAVGIAVAATPKLNIAFDIMHINYSSVNSVGNLNTLGAGPLLGDNDGAGFGWTDQTTYKLGFDYAYSDDLTLRAGINHGENPIKGSQTDFNLLAPAVVETHLTLGATWEMDKDHELTFSYMHAFENEVKGTAPAAWGKYDIKMYQDSVGVAYSWKM